MPTLNVNTSLVAFSDVCASNAQPLQKNFDWTRQLNGVPVSKPESKPFSVSPGVTKTLFSGTRVLGTDNTTTMDLTLNSMVPSAYRMTWSGGTAPAFRTDRALTLNGLVVIVTINNNVTATMSLDPASGQDFSNVVIGDNVWIPSTYTGDAASPFSNLNAGLWTVLAIGAVSSVAAKSLTLRRLSGQPFSGSAETVTVGTDAQFQAFSPDGVQIGDSLNISAGFSSASFGSYTVSTVTANWVEFVSTNPLPLETGVAPDIDGVTIYTDAKRFLRLESDQPVVVRINGDTGSNLQIWPRTVANTAGVGYIELWSTVWQLEVQNLAPGDVANLQLISAE